VQQPIAQLLRFGGGQFPVKEQDLGPGEQVDAGQGQFQPGGVDGELAGREPAEAGVLAAADAVLRLCCVRRFVIKAGLLDEVCQPPLLVTTDSAFAGFRFPPEVIVVAIRWYLRFNLSYRDVEELLVERGVEVDHVTVFRWVQRFTPLLADAARFGRHAPGDRWFVDETYVRVNGVWRYVYRAIDQNGQVIDALVSARRDAATARRFFQRALATLKVRPVEVVTDAAPIYPAVLEDLLPAAWHHVERHANNPIEADHSQLKHRLRSMRGLRTDRTAQVIIAGNAFMQNLRRGHYEIGVEVDASWNVATAFTELALAI
jgi:transposase-like protein